MITKSLTGKTRLRAKSCIFGKPKLILQIEEKTLVTDDDLTCPEGQFTSWRDARTEDLQDIKCPDKPRCRVCNSANCEAA